MLFQQTNLESVAVAAKLGQPEAEPVQSGQQGEEGDETGADSGH